MKFLLIIAFIFLVLWGLGMVFFYTVGAILHILLGIAIVLAVISFFSGRKAKGTALRN